MSLSVNLCMYVFVIGYNDHLRKVTVNNCDNLTELRTPKITVITGHIKSSQSFVTVVW